MKASYRWLCELIPNLAEQATPSDVRDRFTGAGLEVEAVHEFGAASKSVVVARVTKVEPHPSKSNLRLVTLEGRDTVVCGAPNVPAPGGLVVLAPNGTHLPAKGITLEPKAIGGVTSAGMLCSEAELGLRTSGGDHGILVLPENIAPIDTPLSKAIPASHDYIFEIGLTPNRPDGLGHVGLARELAALMGIPFELPKATLSRTNDVRTEDRVNVRIDDLERCPRYGAAVVTGVKVAPSPVDVSYRLESLGIRSISNVVDITNLILLKWGHPIHGFDLARVRGGAINVRRARAGEVLETLDNVKHDLVEDDLVIADQEGAVALAGVMGGAGSELSDATNDVLIECAYFAPRGVRRTARRHGMHTESSHRFERGVDPGDIAAVLLDTSAMLEQLAGGTAAKTRPIQGEGEPKKRAITLTRARMDSLLGITISMKEARETLSRLGCVVTGETPDTLSVEAPTHRPDLTMEADLIEEVVRVHGMDKVPPKLPAIVPQLHDRRSELLTRVRSSAVEVGLSEALTFAFTSAAELAQVRAPEAKFILKNPLSEDRVAMRTSLLPGLIEATRRARRHGVADVRLFTMGARFMAPKDSADPLADEVPSFAAILAGAREASLGKRVLLDVYDAKGVALEIVERATGRAARAVLQAADARSPHLHPKAAASIVVVTPSGERVVGSFGPLHPLVVRETDLGGDALVIELDLRAIIEVGRAHRKYQPIPTLPAATRDISVVVHDDVNADTVVGAIRDAGGELCESAAVFDLYRGDNVPANHRSLAFHVVYRDPKAATDPAKAKTLTDAEVDQRHGAVTKAITERFGAVLRGATSPNEGA